MVAREPRFVLRLPRAEVHSPKVMERLLSRARVRCDLRRLLAAFAFRNDEARFARELLRHRSQLWLFRSNQRMFCGDFIVVDMSSPFVDRRQAWVIDLKLGAPLRLGGGGAGVQLRNAGRALAEVAGVHGALAVPAEAEKLTGDRREVLAYFGIRPPTLACERSAR